MNFGEAFVHPGDWLLDNSPLFEELDRILNQRNLPTRHGIELIGFDEKGQRIGTNLEIMASALKEVSIYGLDKHAQKVAEVYWRWKINPQYHTHEVRLSLIAKPQSISSRDD